MIEYVVIEGVIYPINTVAEIKTASKALTEAGIDQATVWRSPAVSITAIVNNGDPDAIKTTQALFAK